jgi:divalent metal cation (Fe/Co/Zn/Cd) transporter
VFSNCVALATSIGGYYSRPWLDPLGGIVIGFYILYTWYNTGLGKYFIINLLQVNNQVFQKL